MRKQYHFRGSARGLLAWDVDKLVALTAGLPVVEVPLAAIRELDQAYWYRDAQSVPTCRSLVDHMRLVQEADIAFPIILAPDGAVLDGMHRVAKALLQGLPSVRAYRLAALPEPDYVGVHPDDLPYDD